MKKLSRPAKYAVLFGAVFITVLLLNSFKATFMPAANAAGEISASDHSSYTQMISGTDEVLAAVSDSSVSVSDAADIVSDSDRIVTAKDTIKIMGQGMLGIFIVMVLIYLVVVVLNKISVQSDSKE